MMYDPMFWLSVLQIVWIDVILSGDNAIVISLACRELPPRQRTIGITLGVVLALVLRIAMAAGVVYLLGVQYLKILGGLLLLYIAVKVIIGEDEQERNAKHTSKLLHAVVIIALADVSMSLDNVVAIAGASRGNDLVFILGLLVSMPLMIVGASLITSIVNRFPILVWFGGALLGWIAGELIATDPVMHDLLPTPAVYGIACAGIIVVLTGATIVYAYRRRQCSTKTVTTGSNPN